MSEKFEQNDKLNELISSVLAEELEIPAGLLSKIMSAIFWRQRFYAGVKASGFLVLSLISVVALFFTVQETLWQINQSGILNILSLLFSDLTVILANWQSFVLSCLEALPIGPLVLTVGAMLLLLVSLKYVSENLSRINFHSKLRVNY